VFIHAARPQFTPTAGCVALELSSLRRLLARVGPRTRIVVD
jgi:L,D-peptidoglycan transpeptidase YkuD (ErfK/YbiS/YcfS/YnhG family)